MKLIAERYNFDMSVEELIRRLPALGETGVYLAITYFLANKRAADHEDYPEACCEFNPYGQTRDGASRIAMRDSVTASNTVTPSQTRLEGPVMMMSASPRG